MYRRILVPLDGSATSFRGLREAAGVAKAHGARLRLLNVLDETLFVPVPKIAEVIASLRAEGQKALDAASKVAEKQDLKAETHMVESRGRPVSDVILDEARKWRADLIVMGTHGRRGVNRLLLGSDAERVLRGATVPLLLVKAEEGKSQRARKRR
jgi:nucleotide-binding universal stress UspA family protein